MKQPISDDIKYGIKHLNIDSLINRYMKSGKEVKAIVCSLLALDAKIDSCFYSYIDAKKLLNIDPKKPEPFGFTAYLGNVLMIPNVTLSLFDVLLKFEDGDRLRNATLSRLLSNLSDEDYHAVMEKVIR